MYDFEKKFGPEVNPKPKFLNPRKNPKTRNPTRAKSKNPKPDPRGEKLTRPIPKWLQRLKSTFFNKAAPKEPAKCKKN